jgi:hypothetical protein
MNRVKQSCLLLFTFLLLSSPPAPLTANAAANVVRIGETYYTTLSSAVTAASSGDTLYILEDTTVTATTNITKNLVIQSETGSIKTLKRGFNGQMFNVSGNSSLTLKDLTLDGNKSVYSANTGPLVYLGGTSTTDPTFVMEDGATLKDNRTVNGATAVQVVYGTFNMTGGLITGNVTDYGISVLYGTDTSRAIHLLGGEISGNTANTTSASVGAIYAYQFGSISVGGDMVIHNNFKGTAASTSFADLHIGSKQIQVTEDFSGEVYVYSDNKYQFGNVFGTLVEGKSMADGHFYNNRNAYLHGEKDSLNQIKWDYSYSSPVVIGAPTSSTLGLIRGYAYVDASGTPSSSIYEDFSLPVLNPTDYTVSYDKATDKVTYLWKNTEHGTFSFDVSFSSCDIVTARSIGKDILDAYLSPTPSQAIIDIVTAAKTSIDNAVSPDAITTILNDTETAIINQKVIEEKGDVEQTLFTYIGNPENPSSEILNIIQDAVDAVDVSNYEDTSAIVVQAKALLDAQLLADSKEEGLATIVSLVDALTSSPSTAMLALETEAFNAVLDATSISEVQSLVSSYADQIYALFVQETIDNAKAEIDALVTSLTDDPSGELLTLVTEAKALLDDCTSVGEVNSTLTDCVAQINALYLQDQIALTQGNIDALVASLTDDPSEGILALVAQAMTALDNATSVESLSGIFDTYADLILEQRLNELATLLAETFNECANTNRHEYSDESLALLESIFEAAEDFFSDDTNDAQAKIDYLEEAIADLTDVPIDRIGDFNPDDENFDETMFDPTLYHGVLEPNVPLQSDAQLLINIVDLTDTEALYEAVINNRIIPKFHDQTVEQIRDSFVDQVVFSEIDMRLVDGDNNSLLLASGTEFQVTLLLPESYRVRENVSLVYLEGDEVEVFKTSREDNLLSFTTDHFGSFYLLGDARVGDSGPLIVHDPNEGVLNLWWVIILELVLIAVEAFLIFKKYQEKNEKEEVRAQLSLIPLLPLLLKIIPNGAILIIIVLFVVLLILGAYLVFLFQGKDLLGLLKKKETSQSNDADLTKVSKAEDPKELKESLKKVDSSKVINNQEK